MPPHSPLPCTYKSCNPCRHGFTLIPQPLLPEREQGSRKALSGLPLAHFWERGTEGVRAEMCIHRSPEREKGSRKALSGLPLAHFWERGTEGVRAEMCIHRSHRPRCLDSVAGWQGAFMLPLLKAWSPLRLQPLQRQLNRRFLPSLQTSLPKEARLQSIVFR